MLSSTYDDGQQGRATLGSRFGKSQPARTESQFRSALKPRSDDNSPEHAAQLCPWIFFFCCNGEAGQRVRAPAQAERLELFQITTSMPGGSRVEKRLLPVWSFAVHFVQCG
jgi:hypothetical protein